MPLDFFCEDVLFELPSPTATAAWVAAAVKQEKAILTQVNCIFCSDRVLYALNKKHLNHDTYTDVLTFDYTPKSTKKALEGDIFISVDRVRENAKTFNSPFNEELHRVLIHGVLHLLGFDDKKASDKALMQQKEEIYLSLLP